MHRLDLFDRALELTDVGLDVLRDVVGYLVGQLDAHLYCFVADDGDSSFKVRRLDVREQTPFKTGLHALLERVDLLRRTVGGEDDLLFRLVQRIKGMEEFLLRALLAGDELYVVEQQQIDDAILVAEGLHIRLLDCGDQLVGEILALYINNAEFRVRAAQDVRDRVHQMGLAQTGVAVDEQRVVFRSRALRDRIGRRVSEFVGRADDEPFKGIVIVRRRRLGGGAVFPGHHHNGRCLAGQLIQRVLKRFDEFVGNVLLLEV